MCHETFLQYYSRSCKRWIENISNWIEASNEFKALWHIFCLNFKHIFQLLMVMVKMITYLLQMMSRQMSWSLNANWFNSNRWRLTELMNSSSGFYDISSICFSRYFSSLLICFFIFPSSKNASSLSSGFIFSLGSGGGFTPVSTSMSVW